MSGGGGQTVNQEPWGPSQPYIVGNEGQNPLYYGGQPPTNYNQPVNSFQQPWGGGTTPQENAGYNLGAGEQRGFNHPLMNPQFGGMVGGGGMSPAQQTGSETRNPLMNPAMGGMVGGGQPQGGQPQGAQNLIVGGNYERNIGGDYSLTDTGGERYYGDNTGFFSGAGGSGLGGSTYDQDGNPVSGPTGYVSEANRLYNQGPQYMYPGQTFAGTQQGEQAYMNQASQYANQVNPYINQSMANNMDIQGQLQGPMGDYMRAISGQGAQGLNYFSSGQAPAAQSGYQGGVNQYLPGYVAAAQSQALMGQNAANMDVTNQYARNVMPALQQTRDASTLAQRDFQETTLPALRSQSSMVGGYGGSRQGIAEGIAARGVGEQAMRNAGNLGVAAELSAGDIGQSMWQNASNTGQNIANMGASMYGQGAENEQGRQLQNYMANAGLQDNAYSRMLQSAGMQTQTGAGMYGNMISGANQAASLVPGMTGAAAMPATMSKELGQYQRALAQMPINEAMSRWQNQYSSPWSHLQNYAGMVNPAAALGQMTNQSGGGNMALGGLGGAATGAGMAGAMGLTGGAAFAPWMLGGAGLGMWGSM